MKRFLGGDTIVAIATPEGEGAIGIIRVSGPDAHRISSKIIEPFREKITPRLLFRGRVIDPESGRWVDDVLYTFFKEPHSYTGEDMVEIYAHGNPLILKKIINILIKNGARIAEPGEFTKRAFLNGKMDLVQAEAVCELIRAKSEEELTIASLQIRGELSERFVKLTGDLKLIAAMLEADIDFNDEDIEIERNRMKGLSQQILDEIDGLLRGYEEGKYVRGGHKVAIAGRTNVGKSSLLNIMLRKERAIVTEWPGTTRDTVEGEIYLDGKRIVLVDTAGIRETGDPVEMEGIKRSRKAIDEAEVVIFMIDGSIALGDEDYRIAYDLKGRTVIAVINKIDKDRIVFPNDIDQLIPWRRAICEISALYGWGVEELKGEVKKIIGINRPEGLIIGERHRLCLERARGSMERAIMLMKEGAPEEIISIEVKDALQAVCEITGEYTTDDILDEIFKNFCVGK